jgi:hypothetical protein
MFIGEKKIIFFKTLNMNPETSPDFSIPDLGISSISPGNLHPISIQPETPYPKATNSGIIQNL